MRHTDMVWLAFVMTTMAAMAGAAQPPKAVIFMLGDDYGYDNVGFAHGPLQAGNPEMRTPNMDQLVSEGIVLERHYVFKYCSPTRSSFMSGRLPVHVNQNNRNNDIEAASGVDLRYTFIAEKMKEAGYFTAMVGKSHLGARSPANLPINRGFDVHFGFLKGGEDHYSQGSGSQDGEGPGTVDLWDGHGLSNMTGIYSGYLYAQKAVDVINNFSSSVATHEDAQGSGLFMYLAWHNTHTPLECPEEWMYPSYPAYNNSETHRMTYNCMARILDDGIGNVTAALKARNLWDDTLMLFSADNGGWVGSTGSNNYPLKGSKVSDFEGGVRAVSFLSGGYLPQNLHGTHHSGFIHVADWYGTLCNLVGVSPKDDVPGLPPVDSIDVWQSILTPNANATNRTEIFLSWSCTTSSANVTGCDPNAPSIYNTSGDPTAGQGPGDMALISGQYKIIIGQQQGRGIWFGPVYPNGTNDAPSYPCASGCLYNIITDPTEHVNLKDTMPTIYQSMLKKLMALGKTVYQTDYAEPGTETCLTGEEARAYYVGHNTCIKRSPNYNPSLPACDESVQRHYLGPMCFHKLPPVPSPPAPSPAFSLRTTNGFCLTTTGEQFEPLVVTSCNKDTVKHWVGDGTNSDWLEWSPTRSYAKVSLQNEPNRSVSLACKRGIVYINPDESGGPTHQGFAVSNITSQTVQLKSSLCSGLCLGFMAPPTLNEAAKAIPCSSVEPWLVA